METTLTQERLKDLLEYLPELGRFKRKKTTAQYKAGDIAGSYDCTNGYRRLMVNKKVYKEHILVWFYHTGHWPNNQIDHINCIKDDNRFENLRDVTQTINMYNKTQAHKNNKSSGILGVTKYKNKYYARLRSKGKLIHIGTFLTKTEASTAYQEFKELYQSYVE